VAAEASSSSVAVAASREKRGLEGRRVSHRMRASDANDATVDEAAMSTRQRRRCFPEEEDLDLEQSLGDCSGSPVIRDMDG
jgi:hypothetical protein